MHLNGIGGFTIENLELRAPGWEGDSARLAHMDRIAVRFSPWKILRGELEIRSIDIDTLTVRVAEKLSDPGSFNFSALQPKSSTTTSTPNAPMQRPAVTHINRLAIESGVDSDGKWELAGRLDMRGDLHPSVGMSDELDVRLDGLATERGAAPFETVHGRFNLRTYAFNVEVDELKLRKESLAIAPLSAQKLLDQLDLQGSIERASISFDGENPPEAELRLRNMRVSFPVEELGGVWSGFVQGKSVPTTGRPRIDVREGVLKLTKDSLSLENLVGDFSASNPSRPVLTVPVQASASIQIPTDDLPPFQWNDREAWFKNALTAAKIDAQISVRNFSSPAEGDARVLFLPKQVTDAFQDFGLTKWTVDIEAEAHRGAGTSEKPGAVVASAEVRLSDASGCYKEFPYPVDQATALMRLEGDTVKIVRFVGRGSENAQIELTGSLTSLASGAEIEIAIKGTNAPLDSRLLNAFDAEAKSALEQLFDADAAASLASAKLLPDAKWIAKQTDELSRDEVALHSDTSRAPEIERLKRSIAAGPFKLGGYADLDIRVYSPPGFNTGVQTTGTVNIRAAGLTATPFPYPLRIENGIITLLDESIVLSGGGLQGVTPAGGRVTVAGNIEIRRTDGDSRDVVPQITLQTEDDAINPALLAAIPHDVAAGAKPPLGWPGRNLAPSAALLQALGLSGSFTSSGTIGGHESNAFAFQVVFANGRVAPDAHGIAWLTAQNLDWPPEFTLDQVQANLEINDDFLRLSNCTARRGTGTVTVTAHASLTGPESDIDVRFDRIPLDRAFEPMLDSDAMQAAAFWQKYQPSGALNGAFTRKTSAQEPVFQGSIEPLWIEVTLDGDRVRGDLLAGHLNVDGSGIRADDLGFRLTSFGRDDGLLRLTGSLDKLGSLDATLTNGRFESPIVRAALRDQSSELADFLASGKTTGLFDATTKSEHTLTLELHPKSVAFDHHDTRSTLTFTPNSVLHLAADEAHGTCAVSFAGGDATADFYVDLQGQALRGVTLSGAIEAQSYSNTVRALLTPTVEAVADSLSFAADGPISLHAEAVKLRWDAGSAFSQPDGIDVQASASVQRAHFDVGPQLDDFDGSATLTVHQQRTPSTEDSFTCAIDANAFKAFGRNIGASHGDVSRASTDGDLIVLAKGDFLGGRWSTDSVVEHASNKWRADVRMVNANYGALASPDLESVAVDRSGRCTMSASLGGLLDDGQSTDLGRGSASVRDAVIAESPLLMRLASITQFMLPVSGALKEADAEFAIKGELAYIEPLELCSPSLKLDGLGTIRLTDYAVAAHLRAAGQMGALSDLLAGITHSLFGIRVDGTFENPSVGLAPLAGIFCALSGSSTSISAFPLPPAQPPTLPPAVAPQASPTITPDTDSKAPNTP
ncbi:MAG: hypothetical protein EXS10_04180 [Phycisphaerales bacterium]|nr:hypothetical protein [Phycisphaerales bacterium]